MMFQRKWQNSVLDYVHHKELSVYDKMIFNGVSKVFSRICYMIVFQGYAT